MSPVKDDPYYLIKMSHLPEVMRRVAQVTELLKHAPSLSVIEATTQVGISRSAYYKYKDAILPFHSMAQGQIVTVTLTLRHKRGILSDVLNHLAMLQANILTINQSLPLQGMATVILSMDTRFMADDIDVTVEAMRSIPGVEQVAIIGQG